MGAAIREATDVTVPASSGASAAAAAAAVSGAQRSGMGWERRVITTMHSDKAHAPPQGSP